MIILKYSHKMQICHHNYMSLTPAELLNRNNSFLNIIYKNNLNAKIFFDQLVKLNSNHDYHREKWISGGNRSVVILVLGINTIFVEPMDSFLRLYLPKIVQTKISVNCF